MFFSIELLYSPIPPIAKDLYTIHSFYAILRPVFGLIHVLFDVIATPREVVGYRKEEHAPVPAAFDALGDTFLVDYVRVFDRK